MLLDFKTGFFYLLPGEDGKLSLWTIESKVDVLKIDEDLQSVWVDCGCLERFIELRLEIYFLLFYGYTPKSQKKADPERETFFEMLTPYYCGVHRGFISGAEGENTIIQCSDPKVLTKRLRTELRAAFNLPEDTTVSHWRGLLKNVAHEREIISVLKVK